MKQLYPFVILLSMCIGHAQQSQEKAVEIAIKDFFEAFHAQDSTLLREKVTADIRMQTIGKSSTGTDSVITVAFESFVNSIVRIPDTLAFEERLLSISAKVDGSMAQAWTPYEFWIDGKLSHCGVNSFQLFKENNSWKILHIIDTRRREGCRE